MRAETARFGTTQMLNKTVRFPGVFGRLEGLRAPFIIRGCWGITLALACGMWDFGVISGLLFPVFTFYLQSYVRIRDTMTAQNRNRGCEYHGYHAIAHNP